MNKELAKTYDPKEVEDRIYESWIKGNYFHAEVDPEKQPYTIVIPPPNVTGQLHMGHALDETLQDILIRYHRMLGDAALWLPGTDHASIATEAKLVDALKAEGLTKEEIGREAFMERAWAWKEKYEGRIIEQLKKLGSSCDWARTRFTMDEGCNKAVVEVFNRLYEKELIYRGERMINWCPCCCTSISDAEVEFDEKDGHFWHLRYPLTDGSGDLELATTRPETMLGDTAVAVHPEDERYRHLIGRTVMLPLMEREIPIIADEYVEPEFGTGVVKITPAHDPNDFEVGLRHDLPVINIMTERGVINENGGAYAGMERYAARKQVVADLEAKGLISKIEDIQHNVGSCYRCGTIVEPRVSLQWFVNMEPLAKPAVEAVRTGKTQFVPDRFAKIYYHWMENIRDWCISRQLWWGHRIPAWYCDDCGAVTVARETPSACRQCGGTQIRQDEDTLDTWFSSALWPFSTLGWPDQTPELEYFYPTNTLVTGYDIIFFWVARMIFSGVEQMGETPFNTVFIHGIVRDAQGRKMSKSLGNGIDPLEVIDRYGADALRFTLATGNSPGNDMRFMENKVESSRNFANKIWNAARFILMNIEGHTIQNVLPETMNPEDRWILSRFNGVVREVTENLDKYELGLAVQKLYDFLWDVFCDWYIELGKTRIQEDAGQADSTRHMLVYILTGTLKLLHPFMPYITEEIWQSLPHEGDSIMVAAWPKYDEAYDFPAEETDMDRLVEAIRAIRNRRAEMNVPPSKKAKVYIATVHQALFTRGALFIKKLAYASDIQVGDAFDPAGAVTIVTGDAKLYIPMGELIDIAEERARLNKALEKAQKELDGMEKKLANQAFTAKAPAKVVDEVRGNAEKVKERMKLIEESLAAL